MRLLVLVLVLCGCGASSPVADGGTANICPSNPQFCSGKCCGDVCKATQTDTQNCGGCGVACGVGEACLGGQCGCPVGPGNVLKCPAGKVCCGDRGCRDSCDVVVNDMAILATDMSTVSSCMCAIPCASGLCLGNNCCWEQTFPPPLGTGCMPDPNCIVP